MHNLHKSIVRDTVLPCCLFCNKALDNLLPPILIHLLHRMLITLNSILQQYLPFHSHIIYSYEPVYIYSAFFVSTHEKFEIKGTLN